MQLSSLLCGENKFRAYLSLLQQTSAKNYYKQNIQICMYVNVVFTVIYDLNPGCVVEIITTCTTLVDKR